MGYRLVKESLKIIQHLTERYPETLVEEFLTHGVEKDAKILDMACGPGNVAFIVRFFCLNVYYESSPS